MTYTTLIGCFAWAAISATAIASPFRTGLPPALPAPAVALERNAPDAIGLFANRYAAAKRPRIAIYWNRELGDQLAARYEDYTGNRASDDELEIATRDETRVEHGSTSLNERTSKRSEHSETTHGTRLLPAAAARASTPESVDWRLESAFLHPFLTAGVQLIDRNVTMRMLTNGTAPDDRPDVQHVEATALAGKADLLMEVLMTPDSDSPIGCRFRVTVKDVRSGAIVALLSTRAIPRSDSISRWVAAPGGYRKVTTTSTPVLEQFGERLAEEAMFHLAGRW